MPFKELADMANELKNRPKKKETPKKPAPDTKIKQFQTILKNIKTRVSVRRFDVTRDVSHEIIMQLIDAGKYAPSAGNYQPWEFVIVREAKNKEELVNACFKNVRRSMGSIGFGDEKEEWMLQAPVFIVVCINQRLATAIYGRRGKELYGIQGVAAAIENILLAAHSLGLGACWIGAFDEIKVASAAGIPDYVRPCAMISIGWPTEKPDPQERQDPSEFVHVEKFGRTLRELRVRDKAALF